MTKLELALMAVIWNTILQRVNATNLSLQKPGIPLITVVGLYRSLIGFLDSMKDHFHVYEKEAMELLHVDGASYKDDTQRIYLQKQFFDEIITRELTCL